MQGSGLCIFSYNSIQHPNDQTYYPKLREEQYVAFDERWTEADQKAMGRGKRQPHDMYAFGANSYSRVRRKCIVVKRSFSLCVHDYDNHDSFDALISPGTTCWTWWLPACSCRVCPSSCSSYPPTAGRRFPSGWPPCSPTLSSSSWSLRSPPKTAASYHSSVSNISLIIIASYYRKCHAVSFFKI